VENEAVVARHGRGLVREAGAVKRSEEEVAGAIPGEYAPRPVPTVGRRSQPHDQQAGRLVSETRHGPPPVLFVAVTTDSDVGHMPAPPPQSRAALAGHDVPRDAFE
jgi:hypothetical protein